MRQSFKTFVSVKAWKTVYFLTLCILACSSWYMVVKYSFSASVSQLAWSGRSLTAKKK